MSLLRQRVVTGGLVMILGGCATNPTDLSTSTVSYTISPAIVSNTVADKTDSTGIYVHVTQFSPKNNAGVTKTCNTQTIGGNSNGAICVFPFIYEGVFNFECIKLNNLVPWCGTTKDYDTDKKWGNCAGLSIREKVSLSSYS